MKMLKKYGKILIIINNKKKNQKRLINFKYIQKCLSIFIEQKVQNYLQLYIRINNIYKTVQMDKRQSTSTTFDFSLSSSRYSEQQSHNMDKLKSIKCSCGNKAKMVCIDKMCKTPALICQEHISQCDNKLHKSCFMIPLKSISSKIQDKILNVDQYVQNFNKRTDQFVDNLIQEVSKIQDAFKVYAQKNYSLALLNEVQKKIFSKIQKNEINQMKGLQFAELFNEMYQKNENKDDLSIKQDYKNIEKMWENIQVNTKKSLSQFKTHLNLNLKFQKSNIVKTQQENETLLQLLEKKVKNVKLLYKASQNNFKLDNFYKCCTNISNTLVLIQTEYDKKVGGYTPLVWKKVQNGQFMTDNSNSSFIFSLTNNQKLKQKSITESGICYNKNTGPIFSSKTYCDIRIQQQANQNKICVGFNCGYSNQTYKQRNKTTRQRFSGNPNNNPYTKLKEWEVWEVIYQQNDHQYKQN